MKRWTLFATAAAAALMTAAPAQAGQPRHRPGRGRTDPGHLLGPPDRGHEQGGRGPTGSHPPAGPDDGDAPRRPVNRLWDDGGYAPPPPRR